METDQREIDQYLELSKILCTAAQREILLFFQEYWTTKSKVSVLSLKVAKL